MREPVSELARVGEQLCGGMPHTERTSLRTTTVTKQVVVLHADELFQGDNKAVRR